MERFCHAYACNTVTMIKIMNFFFIGKGVSWCHIVVPPTAHSHPLPPHPQATTDLLSTTIDQFVFFLFYLFFCLFRVTLVAYGGFQGSGGFGSAAAHLCHSDSNAGSESCVWDLPHSSRQHRILNPLSEVRNPTCVLTDTS